MENENQPYQEFENTQTTIIPEVSFKTKAKTFLLKVRTEEIDTRHLDEIVTQGEYTQKSEYHVTVIGYKAANKIKKH
ncbi:MAG: hypothetical protein COU27_00045 [Candidatus Levybacteria bacterium CG10_big_fil_rev_8_21_14_0_10_36_7]|nr:MAG: hypothetical protein COU27_00045 [Candidatus Levybacteria bacterium CG10_big_fil_rev_8_21_14_0_10_36_7]